MANNNLNYQIVHDITGFNRDQVVKVLTDIVNESCYQRGHCLYYLEISRVDEGRRFHKLFVLEPNSTTDQPGNGIIYVLKSDSQFTKRSYGQDLVADLNKTGDTPLFAKHLKKLFENNSKIADYPFVTSEVYILLLFEIARRKVRDSEDSSPKKKELDALSIDETITNLIDLMKASKCDFKDIFSKKGKFHCFSGSVYQRKKVIDEIKSKHETIKPPQTEAPENDKADELTKGIRNLSVGDALSPDEGTDEVSKGARRKKLHFSKKDGL